jgi:DNA-binding GntR family transcriptional regulator
VTALTLSLSSVQRSKSLQELAYRAIRSGILSGELAPGERLVETHLADRLQVSRTPIREAIRQLQRDTLVTADRSGNLRVTAISVEDAVQLYDCRLALERLSVQGACQQATRAQIFAMGSLVEQAEKLVAQQPSIATMLELDHRFHHHIAECSGNAWLVGLVDQVFDKMTLLRVQTTRQNPHVLEIRCEHRAIYEAIARRDVEKVMGAIEAHLVASKDRVVSAVEKLSADS